MTRILLLLAFVCLVSPALADDKVQKIVEEMQASDGYRYTIVAGAESVAVQTISGEQYGQVLEKDTGLRKSGKGWEASPHIAHRIAPYIIGKGFTTQKTDVLHIDVNLGAKPVRLYAASRADAVYALKLLAPQGTFRGWLDANAAAGLDLVELKHDLNAATKEMKGGAVLEQAKALYDARRPALVRQFAQSYLYFAPAKDMAWSPRMAKDGKHAYAVATTSDLMYFAEFWFRFKHDGGKWVFDKVFARETFKGE